MRRDSMTPEFITNDPELAELWQQIENWIESVDDILSILENEEPNHDN